MKTFKQFFIEQNLKPAPKGNFDPKELEKGIKVEMEHTTNRKTAETIAKQHLDEDPKYYTKLEKLHKD